MKKYAKKIFIWFRSVSFKTRMTATFFVFMIIILLLVSILTYSRTSRRMENQVILATEHILKCVEQYLDYRLGEANRIAESVLSNSEVIEVLAKDPQNYPLGEQIEDCEDIIRFIKGFERNYGIFRLRLYVQNGLIYSNENVNIFNIENIKGKSWFKELEARERNVYCDAGLANYIWNNKKEIFYWVRAIFDENNINKVIGVVQVDVLKSDIDSIFENAYIYDQNSILLLREDGTLVSQQGKIWFDVDKEGRTIATLKEGKRWMNIGGRRTYVISKKVRNIDWNLVYLLPENIMFQTRFQFRTEIIVLLFISSIIAFLLTLWGSNINSRRILNLIKKMGSVQKGDFSVQVEVDGADEIGELQKSFNYLIKSVVQLMEEKIKAYEQLKNAEMELLQAQIQPHFLYNTLDLINWRVLRLQDYETSKIVNKLSQFYKIGLSRGRQTISIKDELEHVRLYMDIQNSRFDSRIHFDIQVEEEILSCQIIKILLQPIVENSIVHGILEKGGEAKGNILITGKKIGDCIYLEVVDDGVGMDEQCINNILGENRGKHFGVWNINQRIKLAYGEEYGLDYSANTPHGVRVRIKLPLIKGGDERYAE